MTGSARSPAGEPTTCDRDRECTGNLVCRPGTMTYNALLANGRRLGRVDTLCRPKARAGEWCLRDDHCERPRGSGKAHLEYTLRAGAHYERCTVPPQRSRQPTASCVWVPIGGAWECR